MQKRLAMPLTACTPPAHSAVESASRCFCTPPLGFVCGGVRAYVCVRVCVHMSACVCFLLINNARLLFPGIEVQPLENVCTALCSPPHPSCSTRRQPSPPFTRHSSRCLSRTRLLKPALLPRNPLPFRLRDPRPGPDAPTSCEVFKRGGRRGGGRGVEMQEERTAVANRQITTSIRQQKRLCAQTTLSPPRRRGRHHPTHCVLSRCSSSSASLPCERSPWSENKSPFLLLV
jgi:hypothetical protein